MEQACSPLTLHSNFQLFLLSNRAFHHVYFNNQWHTCRRYCLSAIRSFLCCPTTRCSQAQLKAISPAADDWATVITLFLLKRAVPKWKSDSIIRLLGVCFGQGILSIIGVVSGAIGTPRDEPTKTTAITLLKVIAFLCLKQRRSYNPDRIRRFVPLLHLRSHHQIGVLLYYKRIFTTKSLIITADAMIIAVVFWQVASILVSLQRCKFYQKNARCARYYFVVDFRYPVTGTLFQTLKLISTSMHS